MHYTKLHTVHCVQWEQFTKQKLNFKMHDNALAFGNAEYLMASMKVSSGCIIDAGTWKQSVLCQRWYGVFQGFTLFKRFQDFGQMGSQLRSYCYYQHQNHISVISIGRYDCLTLHALEKSWCLWRDDEHQVARNSRASIARSKKRCSGGYK